MSDFFFITGLPRCRSTWISNLLTTGDAFCYHDLFAEYPSADALELALEASGQDYVGDSDSGLMSIAPDMVQRFPNARWAIILRDPREAADSYWNYFNGTDYPYAKSMTKGDVYYLFGEMQQDLQRAVAFIPGAKLKQFAFDRLGEEDVIRELWDWCLPNISFNPLRWRMLETFQVNIIPSKTIIHPSLKEEK